MNSEFLYIGHRGTRTIFDENTIAAFQKAIEFGANYIEFDVRKTKDGKLIILHDPGLDRTTKSSGLVKKLSYDEIRKFRTKNFNETIPLLSDVLTELKGKTLFIIEFKDDDIKDNLLNIVNDHNLLEDCIFSGRNLQELSEIKKIYHSSRVCYNITKGLGFKVNEFLKSGSIKNYESRPDLISLRADLISKKFIETCHENKIKCLAWNFIFYKDPIYQIKMLVNLGIDGILFDDHRNILKIKQWVNSN